MGHLLTWIHTEGHPKRFHCGGSHHFEQRAEVNGVCWIYKD